MLETHPKDWIIDAIKISADNGKNKLSYIKGILENWKIKGAKEIKKGIKNGVDKYEIPY